MIYPAIVYQIRTQLTNKKAVIFSNNKMLPFFLQFNTGSEKDSNGDNMQKTMIIITMLSILLLTGCGDSMPEDELVDRGKDSRTKEAGEDLQASSFPFLNMEEDYQKKREFYTLPELKEQVEELLGDHYWPEVDLSKEELEELTGISEDMYVDFLAEKQSLDSHIDTMIIIHAREDYVGAVEQAIEKYRSSIIEENQNYPQNLGKAKASRMETIDDYVCFVQLGADTTVVADKGSDAVTAYCLEENERALYVLEQAILRQ